MLLKRFFLYGMPIYLTAIEVVTKHFVANDPISLVLSGPTIAVAGISLILPVMTPKPVPLPQNLPPNTIVINQTDQTLIEIATIAFFVLILLWVFSIYVAHQSTSGLWAV